MPPPNQPTTNSSITQTLVDLGLAENDARLYEILLANPDATITVLKQKSPFSRTMLYYILESLEGFELVEKKEVSPVQDGHGKKTVYNAAPPEKLEEFISEQERELDRQKSMLKKVVGDLGSVYRLAHGKPGVRFFEGPDGIKEVTFDSLNAAGEIYTFADTEAVEKFAKEMNASYSKQRLAKKIAKKIIALDTPFAREHYQNISSSLTQIRFISAKLNPFQTGMQIYNNRISYATLTDKKMIGVIIEDANIAQMHRSLFEFIWNGLPPFGETVKPVLVTPPPAPTRPDAPLVVLNP